MKLAVQGTFWIFVYLAVTVAPLVFAWAGPEPGRGFLINFSVALGFVGLAMMGLQFALVARFKTVSAPFGMDVVLQYHRQMAYVALLFVLAHPILLFVEDTRFLALLDPWTSPLRAKLAVTSTVALLGLVAFSLWRKKLRMSYELWQLTHGLLGVLIIVTALAHVFLVGYYVNEPWERALWLAMSAGFVLLLVWVRLIRPLERRRNPWRVEEVIAERGNTYTVALQQQNENGFHFEPGQFAWIMAGKSPFATSQHPFSISSSAERTDRVTLSVKAAGDFTSSIAALKPGTTVYLDGPHGAFTLDRHEGPGFVFIGAGVGITPLMSMLRTLADRDDVRPCYLFLGNRDQESITFHEEIEGLRSKLDLKVVHVLSRPEEGWEGEQGRIDASVLSRGLTGAEHRHLPQRCRRLVYFLRSHRDDGRHRRRPVPPRSTRREGSHRAVRHDLRQGGTTSMRRTYTTGLVVLTAALLVVACFFFALAQGGQAPEPQRGARRPNHHLVRVGRVGDGRGVGPELTAG